MKSKQKHWGLDDWRNCKQPLLNFVEVFNYYELTATINEIWRLGLTIIKIDATQTEFFQSFHVFYGNRAANVALMNDGVFKEKKARKQKPKIPAGGWTAPRF